MWKERDLVHYVLLPKISIIIHFEKKKKSAFVATFEDYSSIFAL